jgi:hypothetical protein
MQSRLQCESWVLAPFHVTSAPLLSDLTAIKRLMAADRYRLCKLKNLPWRRDCRAHTLPHHKGPPLRPLAASRRLEFRPPTTEASSWTDTVGFQVLLSRDAVPSAGSSPMFLYHLCHLDRNNDTASEDRENGSSNFLRNVRELIPEYTASHPRRRYTPDKIMFRLLPEL